MKSRPRIGKTGELDVPADMQHAVGFAGDGMPAVVSTPVGQTIHCTARVLAMGGAKTQFQSKPAMPTKSSSAASTNAPSSARKISGGA